MSYQAQTNYGMTKRGVTTQGAFRRKSSEGLKILVDPVYQSVDHAYQNKAINSVQNQSYLQQHINLKQYPSQHMESVS